VKTVGAASYIILGATALIVWYAHDVLLLIFAGSLLALVLRGAAEWISKKTRIRIVWSVWLTAIVGVVVIGAAAIALAGAVAPQIAALSATLPNAIGDVVQSLRTTALGLWIANNLPSASALLPDAARLLSHAGGILSSALGAAVAFLVVIFVSIAGALEPELYVNGVVALFPASRRARIRSVISEIGCMLRTWFIARLFTMTVTASLVTIGLTILHVPLAGALGALAGVMAFVPNIGAFVAALPAVLLAFVQSPQAALAVAVMYVVVHVLDDFVVAPLVERQVVKLPPVLTLVAQIVLGLATGAVGVMLAAPLVAMTIVIVRRLWVEDVADLGLRIFPVVERRHGVR
jgi:predicted PurR-regulated permease PerM